MPESKIQFNKGHLAYNWQVMSLTGRELSHTQNSATTRCSVLLPELLTLCQYLRLSFFVYYIDILF